MAWQDIVVSSKILGHISAGVYRSAGGALKELVSNAFDANATRVVITTNAPSFDVVTCFDNGTGMKLEDFEWIMQEGIGESSKRIDKNIDPTFNRPVIGRLGIGMLGIAQVCHSFKIVSHHRETKTAFQATVRLVDFLRERIDAVDPTEEDVEDLQVGQFQAESIEYEPSQAGTYIVAVDVRSAFIRKFRENPGPRLPSKFSSFLDILHKERSVKELGAYWQMVWELAYSCPISYIEEGPFLWNRIKAPKGFKEKLEKLKQTLVDYNFEVVVDGLSLRKPHMFPYPTNRTSPEQGKPKPMTGQLFPIEENMEVYGKPLKLIGYIYMQDGQAVEPIGLRGLLIRIRNVAIGGYDPTFLDYPKIEGPRFNWISSEIYVEEGLEQALNIDRDSFNELHSHFVKVQQVIHRLLDKVFSEASKGVTRRSQAKKENERSRKWEALEQLISEELSGNYRLVETEGNHLPLVIDTKSKRILINTESSLWPRSKSKRDLAQYVAVAFEISMLNPKLDGQRERFYKVLSRILNL